MLHHATQRCTSCPTGDQDEVRRSMWAEEVKSCCAAGLHVNSVQEAPAEEQAPDGWTDAVNFLFNCDHQQQSALFRPKLICCTHFTP